MGKVLWGPHITLELIITTRKKVCVKWMAVEMI